MTGRTFKLKLDIRDWWHIGTGQSRGGEVDAVVAREPDTGLPYVPGKTVRGLLRDAVATAAEVGAVPVTGVETVFGSEVPGAALAKATRSQDENATLRRARFTTERGGLRVGDASLGPAWQTWARRKPNEAKPLIDALFDSVAATAINDDGLVKEQTLRRIEVAAPMTLTAVVVWEAGESSVDEVRGTLDAGAGFLTALGKGRHRGFGRCHAWIDGPLAYPRSEVPA